MIQLYNTLTRKKELFKPIKKNHVGIYSCGPTVYWNQHLGHMYAYVQWDALIRAFKYSGYKTKWVMNITDVGHLTSDEDTGEDKIEKGAKREGLSVWQIAEKYTKQFLESLELLNIKKPNILCKATDHIQEQISLIEKIGKNGFTYKTQTGLVFDTSKFPDYTKFAKLDLKKLQAGKRVEVDKEKKQPWDFLLWVTNQPNHIMQWNSPWGRGFPGWHIECTAMSTKYLGEKFDIHTGGKEHIPVHHTNEIAQAYGAFKHQSVNYWLHNEWLTFGGEKMSKSSGENILATDLVYKGYDPLSFRYLVLNSHYRRGLNFTWESLKGAQTALNRLKDTILEIKSTKISKLPKKYLDEFLKTINDDLNLPKALALLWKVLRDSSLKNNEKYSLALEFDKVLGLNLGKIKKEKLSNELLNLIDKRELARKKKDFKRADEIRFNLKKKGIILEDTKQGVKWKKEV